MTEQAGAINVYTCDQCRGRIVTRNAVEGTTPFLLACRATKGCRGLMESGFYRVAQDAVPTYEWFRPTPEEARRQGPAMEDHFRMGALDLREITPGWTDIGEIVPEDPGRLTIELDQPASNRFVAPASGTYGFASHDSGDPDRGGSSFGVRR